MFLYRPAKTGKRRGIGRRKEYREKEQRTKGERSKGGLGLAHGMGGGELFLISGEGGDKHAKTGDARNMKENYRR